MKFLDNISRQNIQLSFLLKGIHTQLLRRLSRNLGFLVKFYSRSDSSFEIIKFSPHYLFSYLHLLILSRIQCPKIVSLHPKYHSYYYSFKKSLHSFSLFLHIPRHTSLHFEKSDRPFPISTFHTSTQHGPPRFLKILPPLFLQILSPSFFAIYPQRNETHSPRKNPPSPTPSRQKTSFSKPQPFRAGAARETHLPRHVLPSSLPPSSSFTRAPFRHTYTHSRGQRVRKLGVHDGVTSRKPGSISRRAIRSTAKAPLASFRPFQPSSFLRVCLFSPFRPPPFSPCTRLTDPGGGGGGGGRLC